MAVASDRDPVIAGGAGFTEGVVRERHGDDGAGGMAGAEDVVDAAKPMLAVEGFHAWSRDLVALDGRDQTRDHPMPETLPCAYQRVMTAFRTRQAVTQAA